MFGITLGALFYKHSHKDFGDQTLETLIKNEAQTSPETFKSNFQMVRNFLILFCF